MNRFLAIAVLAINVTLVGGCGTFTPADPDLINDGLRPGAGLFSGPSGEFVLLPQAPGPP